MAVEEIIRVIKLIAGLADTKRHKTVGSSFFFVRMLLVNAGRTA
jgi:hypothetical protein